MKNIIGKIIILSLSILPACAHKTGSHLIDFKPTQSLCLDAIVANMLASGCKDMFVSPSPDHPSAKTIQCSRSVGEINEWTVGSFVVFSSSDASYMESTSLIPVCTDGNSFIFYQTAE